MDTATHPSSRPLRRILVDFVGSMNLAILLFLSLCVLILAGTLTTQAQTSAYYTQQYGAFWFELLHTLGLFNLYSSPWFLLIVSLLMMSVVACIWRNAPRIVASFGKNASEYHPGRFSRSRHWDVKTYSGETLALIKRQLVKRGYSVSEHTENGELHVYASKGGIQKLGYLFIHLSIIVIFLGALLDSNVLSWFNLGDRHRYLNESSIKYTDVADERVVPETNRAFRGRQIALPGEEIDKVIVNGVDGYTVQRLPFTLRVMDYTAERYATGELRDYSVNIEITDKLSHEVVRVKVKADKTITYKGYKISHLGYSAKNARVVMTLNRFADSKPLIQGAAVELPYQQALDAQTFVSFSGLKTGNADPTRKISLTEEFADIGPSVSYQLRAAGDSLATVELFLEPYSQDGGATYHYLMRVTKGGDEPQLIYIPTNAAGNLAPFIAFNHIIYEKDFVRLLFSSKMDELFSQMDVESDYVRKEITKQVLALVDDYANFGREVAVSNMTQDFKQGDEEAAALFGDKMLDLALEVIYEQVRLLPQSQGAIASAKKTLYSEDPYFRDLKLAVDQFKVLGINYLPQMRDYTRQQGAIIIVAKQPGEYAVFAGMLAMMIGVLLIFYINYREYLIRLIPSDDGMAEIRIDAYSNRNDILFGYEFVNLTDVLMNVTV